MKSLIFSLLLLLVPATIQAQSRAEIILQQIEDSLNNDTSLTAYDRKVFRRYKRWSKLIPSQSIIQTHGNMGVVNLGIGWDYGKREQWEMHLLLGFIPKHDSQNAKMTMTLKETFNPWLIKTWNNLYIDPLTCGLYLNTVFGKDFWGRQPDRYPKSYYAFLSTKIRINVFLGQQVTWKIPHHLRKSGKSVSLFYEVSTCDLYLRSMFMQKNIGLFDILGLSVGAKYKFM